MIAATLRDGRDIAWERGSFTVATGDVPAALRRPVRAVRAVEGTDGGVPVIERVQVILEPGTAEYARAALVAVGATTFIDDEP